MWRTSGDKVYKFYKLASDSSASEEEATINKLELK